MELKDLILAVQEKKLLKDDLEKYRDALSNIFAQMQLEIADLEKLEALFPFKPEGTAIARKNAWKATKEGQRLIELKHYCIATKEILRSLRDRLYTFY